MAMNTYICYATTYQNLRFESLKVEKLSWMYGTKTKKKIRKTRKKKTSLLLLRIECIQEKLTWVSACKWVNNIIYTHTLEKYHQNFAIARLFIFRLIKMNWIERRKIKKNKFWLVLLADRQADTLIKIHIHTHHFQLVFHLNRFYFLPSRAADYIWEYSIKK